MMMNFSQIMPNLFHLSIWNISHGKRFLFENEIEKKIKSDVDECCQLYFGIEMQTNSALLLDDDDGDDDAKMYSKNLHNQTYSVLVDLLVAKEVLNKTHHKSN
jgi:hypothetical protein